MEHSIGVGIIIGIIVTIGTIVYKSDKFTANQKRILLPFLLFLPLGLFLIIATWIYNELKNKESNGNKHNQPTLKTLNDDESLNVESSKNTVGTGMSSKSELMAGIELYNHRLELLIKSYNQGLLSVQEYTIKKLTIENEKIKLTKQLDVLVRTELIVFENKETFDRLLELKQTGLITNDEYNLKFKNILSSFLSKRKEESNEFGKQVDNNPKLSYSSNEGFDRKKNNKLVVWSGITIGILSIILIVNYYLTSSNKLTQQKTVNNFIPSQTTSPDTSSLDQVLNDEIIPKAPKQTKEHGKVVDFDGNLYKTIKIGNQEWMIENLNVSTFRNGDVIRAAQSKEEWIYCANNKISAWCYYENDPNNGKKHGKLYNLWAAIDVRQLAPLGWEVPESMDYKILENLFGGFRNAGKHLKSIDFQGGGTNNSGLNIEQCGERRYNGEFVFSSQNQSFWTRTTGSGWGSQINSLSGEVMGVYLKGDCGGMSGSALNTHGFPIRCIKTEND